jgi:hypothetical protein
MERITNVHELLWQIRIERNHVKRQISVTPNFFFEILSIFFDSSLKKIYFCTKI